MSVLGVSEQDKFQIRRHAVISAARAAGIKHADWYTNPELIEQLEQVDAELHGLLDTKRRLSNYCAFAATDRGYPKFFSHGRAVRKLATQQRVQIPEFRVI